MIDKKTKTNSKSNKGQLCNKWWIFVIENETWVGELISLLSYLTVYVWSIAKYNTYGHE